MIAELQKLGAAQLPCLEIPVPSLAGAFLLREPQRGEGKEAAECSQGLRRNYSLHKNPPVEGLKPFPWALNSDGESLTAHLCHRGHPRSERTEEKHLSVQVAQGRSVSLLPSPQLL